MCGFLYSYIDKNKDTFIGTLKTAVSIKSVSAFKENRDDVVKMMNWAADKLTSLKVQVEICDVGKQVNEYFTSSLEPLSLLQYLLERISHFLQTEIARRHYHRLAADTLGHPRNRQE